jgi:hypothetical protein
MNEPIYKMIFKKPNKNIEISKCTTKIIKLSNKICITEAKSYIYEKMLKIIYKRWLSLIKISIYS